MVEQDITETLDLLVTEKSIDKKALDRHLGGCKQVFARLHEPDSDRTHISLSGSGCEEQSRSNGGKADYLVKLAKELCDRQPTAKEIGAVTGLLDCLGQEVVNIDTARMWCLMIEQRPVTWAQLLYVPPARASLECYTEEKLVPYGLARIIVLVCTKDIMRFGYYDKTIIDNPLGVPLFNQKEVEFQPNVKSIPVRAAVSIEAAGKSRLTTAAPAAYTELGELINCFMRNWLSKDPFARIGFEEADKLWEVLKLYSLLYVKSYLNVE